MLFALHTGPAIAGALVAGVAAKRLPPAARGKIRGTYAAARDLVRSRIMATTYVARQLAQQADARIRTTLANGFLIITIWIAFAIEIANQVVETIKVSIEVWRTDGAFVSGFTAEA